LETELLRVRALALLQLNYTLPALQRCQKKDVNDQRFSEKSFERQLVNASETRPFIVNSFKKAV
jgi:hypothetical protein